MWGKKNQLITREPQIVLGSQLVQINKDFIIKWRNYGFFNISIYLSLHKLIAKVVWPLSIFSTELDINVRRRRSFELCVVISLWNLWNGFCLNGKKVRRRPYVNGFVMALHKLCSHIWAWQSIWILSFIYLTWELEAFIARSSCSAIKERQSVDLRWLRISIKDPKTIVEYNENYFL